MKKNIDKTVALKLINQYADNYKRLEEENGKLHNEIKDLKLNLSVNKSMIDTIIRDNDLDKTIQLLMTKYKEETTMLNSKNDHLYNENCNLRNKLLQYETSLTDSITIYKECKDTLELRVFSLENAIEKKDNQLMSLNKKLTLMESKLKNNHTHHHEQNEIYILDPNESLMKMYCDLTLYKEGYDNALSRIKELKSEINQLKQKLHDKDNKDKDYNPKVSIKLLNEIISKCTKKSWETDEWLLILNYLNITKHDIENNVPNNKFFNKLFEAIELLNKIVFQRNSQLTQVMKENSNFNDIIKETRNENMRLLKHIIILKNQLGFSYADNNSNGNTKDQINNHYINNNISLINNFNLHESIKNEVTKKIEEFIPSLCNTNTTFPFENSKMNPIEHSYTFSKNFNFTQVTESSFDIVESSNILQLKQNQTKDLNDNGNDYYINHNTVEKTSTLHHNDK